jgi:hypothetical protein
MTLTEAVFSGIGVVIVAVTPIILAQVAAYKELKLQRDKLDATHEIALHDAEVNASAFKLIQRLIEKAAIAQGNLEGRAELKAEHAASNAIEPPAIMEVHVDLSSVADAKPETPNTGQ